MNRLQTSLSRRTILRMGASIPPLWLAACVAPAATAPAADAPVLVATDVPTAGAGETPAAVAQVEAPATGTTQLLPPTPACGDGDDDEITPAQTEGPYYTPNTPERASFLEPGIAGTKMIVTGYVLATDCQPIAQALLDFWHCDDAGVYDNDGYKLRGHFFSDEAGRFQLETIMPGLYPGRTRHFHVKVQAPNQSVLTTQLYFPNEADNTGDGIFQPALLMDVQDGADGSKIGLFNFVLQLA
jgi:protocatechuate 3,4-dioxygenase beta subunit